MTQPPEAGDLRAAVERVREHLDDGGALPIATDINLILDGLAFLESEGAALSAGACINPGQHGLVGDEHGNTLCTAHVALMKAERERDAAVAEVERLRALSPAPSQGEAELREALEAIKVRVKRYVDMTRQSPYWEDRTSNCLQTGIYEPVEAIVDAALSNPPADGDGFRDGVEAAAKIVEDHGQTWGLSYRSMTDTLAAAIRNLAPANLETGAGKAEGDDLTWFSQRPTLSLDHYSPWFCDDDDQSVEWRVSQVSGPRDDREWDIIGRGETAAEAIKDARAFFHQSASPSAPLGAGGSEA